MKSRDLWKSALLVLTTALPGSMVAASAETVAEGATVNREAAGSEIETVESTTQAFKKPRLVIQDVSLGEQGELAGFVLDGQGKAVSESKVVVRSGRKTVAETTTDKAGRFEVSGLHGGVYQIEHSDGASVFRVWKKGTAPKNARSRALLVVGKPVIRGQSEGGILSLAQPGTLAATAAGVAGGTLGIIGISEAASANDKADAVTARLDAFLATFN
jgi:hypothetical protein